jgi:hypothetical protein
MPTVMTNCVRREGWAAGWADLRELATIASERRTRANDTRE